MTWGFVRDVSEDERRKAIDRAYGELTQHDRCYIDEAVDALISHVKRLRGETRLSPKDALYVIGSAILFDVVSRQNRPRKR